MSRRLQVRVEPLGSEGVSPRERDEIVLAPKDPKFRPSDAAWMIVGLATQLVWVRHARDRNPFVVVKAQLAESDPDTFASLLSVAAAIGFEAHICPELERDHERAAAALSMMVVPPLAEDATQAPIVPPVAMTA